MSGIVFYKTKNLQTIQDFYIIKIGMEVWLQQEKCLILSHGNFLLGFCEKGKIEGDGIITYFFDSKEEVDTMYSLLSKYAEKGPVCNDAYGIYHFYARDPEGRLIECQHFLHPVIMEKNPEELLIKRRSIRNYLQTPVAESIIKRLFNMCRYSPTSMNRQPYYYVLIKNKNICEKLSKVREGASPLNNAPLAVVVCVDPEHTKRTIEDGCIAAYHFILAASSLGLGTCWIADMNRDEVKTLVKIPHKHYIATISPLGYPAESKEVPERRKTEDILKIIGE
ncbi:MAG: nitroreductase family protein [Candidatus Cloacimonetes bacterium]|nr:nitroreductase family protein [Candidatus Cloacimonadota bacterium]